ncbi:MAG: tRNA 2-thiouridine(34) synthase MnmA [Dehalococcoidia bacterium]|nr:tRNA 2-thiouridine(34) synthase MnmA [Dehalococcoidia bacterium]
MTKAIVAVALSGGVDSSVAALLLKEAGYEVMGVYAHLWDSSSSDQPQEQAEDICRSLNIPFRIIDLQKEFERYVVDYFCQEYNQGRTPNPCIPCNQHIKFGVLLNKALSLGADYLATGHYARIEHSSDGYRLLKAKDVSKDQSYFLYTLTQEQLRRILFPVGGYTKAEIHQMAKQGGLPITTRASQDICFISPKNYRAFLAQRFSPKPGDIIDDRGKQLGHHQGIAFYTIGQRHGLGLASGRPLYVIRIEPEHDRLVIGEGNELYSYKVTAKSPSWVTGNPPTGPINITAKIRYKSKAAEATLSPTPLPHPEALAHRNSEGEKQPKNLAQDTLHKGKATYDVCFTQPQKAATPGQAIVFYEGNEVLGGGIIENKN